MPTYEYACTKCGHHLEVVQSFKDEPLSECPECGSRLRKVFGNIGIVLKGSGFYKTDSRSKSTAKVGDRSGSDSSSGKEATTTKEGSGTSDSAKKDAPVSAPSDKAKPSGDSAQKAASSAG
jgi:putative FmdB family regulatory protein